MCELTTHLEPNICPIHNLHKCDVSSEVDSRDILCLEVKLLSKGEVFLGIYNKIIHICLHKNHTGHTLLFREENISKSFINCSKQVPSAAAPNPFTAISSGCVTVKREDSTITVITF